MSQHRPSADASAGLGRSEEATALLPTQRQQALLQTGDEEALGLSAPLRDSMARVVDAMYGDVLPTPPFEPTPDTVRVQIPRGSPAPAPPRPPP